MQCSIFRWKLKIVQQGGISIIEKKRRCCVAMARECERVNEEASKQRVEEWCNVAREGFE
jgi:hypothetical protein